MPILEWDKIGERVFERGVDKGVIYLSNGNAIPWNGLTGVNTKPEKSVEPTYYDGLKINDLVTVGAFSGKIQAITYPDEFLELEGYGEISAGVYVEDQLPKTFHLSYRTKIGSDIDADSTDYKIHIVYNVTALASDKNFVTIATETALTEFEWEITAVPEEVPGFRPSAHIVIDSRHADAQLLSDIELVLYGGIGVTAQLLPFADMIELLSP